MMAQTTQASTRDFVCRWKGADAAVRRYPKFQSFRPCQWDTIFFCFCAQLVESLKIEAAGHIVDSTQKTVQPPEKILIPGT